MSANKKNTFSTSSSPGEGFISQGDTLGKKILVADDDAGIRDILDIILKTAGYTVELKEDGMEILKNKFNVPHLFLIDKQLSESNGLDICRYLKNQSLTKHIPVLIISASPDIGLLAQQAGADGYIEKPFEISYLLKIIRRFIQPM